MSNFRHPIFFVRCAMCRRESPAVKREGRIEPPDQWGAMYTDCCGPRSERFVCSTGLCPTALVHRLFELHRDSARLLVCVFGAKGGYPERFAYVREGSRFRMEPVGT